MSWNAALPANSSLIRLSAGYIRNNNTAIQDVVSDTNLTAGVSYIPNTAPVWFYTNVAPTGWTATGVGGDSLLAIAGGSSAYNTAGGSQVGTWSGPGYALQRLDVLCSSSNPSSSLYYNPDDRDGSANSSNAHSHNWTTTRPTASVGILCTKNP